MELPRQTGQLMQLIFYTLLRCEGRLKPPYYEKKTDCRFDGLSSVAPEAGLEPATL